MDFETTLIRQIVAFRRPWLDDVMILASALGAGGFIWIVTGSIAGIFPRRAAAMWRLWLAIALSFLVVDSVMKPLFQRTRPFEALPEIRLIDARPMTASFPSGHAAMAAAGALSVGRMLPWASWIVWLLAAMVAFSRVYLGVHWPTDVVAGGLTGLAVAWFIQGGRKPRARAHP
jgi:undecaprenyl-diphosphatase